MNIFVLDLDPTLCARYHADIHVGKMAMEASQLLASAHHRLDPRAHNIRGMPKPTHMNHPCAVWVREARGNYLWLLDLYFALHSEFMHRFDKAHGNLLRWTAIEGVPKRLEDCSRTPFAQAMPDKYKDPDPVVAYRNYYRYDKAHMLRWTRREVPEWISSPT